MIVYKVVARTVAKSNKMAPRYCSFLYSPFRVYYSIGQVARPAIGALYAFKSLEHAARFHMRHNVPAAGELVILECAAKESALPRLACACQSRYWKSWWLSDSETRKKLAYTPSKGTIMCEWIKPLKVIQVTP